MSPYDKRSKELLAYADGLKALAVPDKLTVAEASSLFEIWKDDMAINSSECEGVLSGCMAAHGCDYFWHLDTYDELFLSKYVESDGNARDFVWKGLLSNMSA
jgi:small subunit ribosomal protein S29